MTFEQTKKALPERATLSPDQSEKAHFGIVDGGVQSASGTMVTRLVTMAKCLRCGFEWWPRVECPVKCPHCRTPLWNVPRANIYPGKPAPTRKGRPRGRTMGPQKAKPAESSGG